MRLRSLLDLDLPPLVDAERLLAELRDQRTWRLAGAVVLMALAVVSLPVFALAGIRLGAPPLPARASRSESAVLAAERRPVREPRPDLPQRDPQIALTRAP